MRKRSRKRWIKLNWDLCREIVLLRSKGRCENCGEFVEKGMNIDHCFSRTNKELFYETANLTALCKNCHDDKTYRRSDVDLLVYEIVLEREGDEKFEKMREISKKRGSFRPWQDISYHEQKWYDLSEQLANMKYGDI